MISESNRQMLSLLSDVLHDRIPAPIPSEQWPAVRDELIAQCVYAMPVPFVSALKLDIENLKEFLSLSGRNIQVFFTLQKEQQEVLSVLDKAGIPVVVLKGSAAAVNYPHPEARCMGDIDLLVLPSDFERAYETLVSSGYLSEQTPEFFRKHINFHSSNGTEIELHNYFSTSNNKQQNAILDNLLYQAIPHRVFVEVNGSSVPILPPLENGIVLLGHMNQHISTGLGLRQVIDWMYYAEKYLDDDFWEEEFSSTAEKIGMKKLAMVTTAMCQKYLGMKKNINWCSYDPLCDELMEFILNHGNFGSKKGMTKTRTVSLIRLFRDPFRTLQAAQHDGCLTWKTYQRHRWLKPFAWIYQLLRWANHGRKNGLNINSLKQAASAETEETDFLRRLEITII